MVSINVWGNKRQGALWSQFVCVCEDSCVAAGAVPGVLFRNAESSQSAVHCSVCLSSGGGRAVDSVWTPPGRHQTDWEVRDHRLSLQTFIPPRTPTVAAGILVFSTLMLAANIGSYCQWQANMLTVEFKDANCRKLTC